jgi:hypothetical protein
MVIPIVSPSVLKDCAKVENHLASKILPFLPEIIGPQMGNLSQRKGFESKNLMSVVQDRTARNLEQMRNDAQNGGVNIIEGPPSGAMLVMEVFLSSADLPYPEPNSSQSIGA